MLSASLTSCPKMVLRDATGLYFTALIRSPPELLLASFCLFGLGSTLSKVVEACGDLALSTYVFRLVEDRPAEFYRKIPGGDVLVLCVVWVFIIPSIVKPFHQPGGGIA